MTALKVTGGIEQMFDPLGAGGDGENAEPMEPESGAMNVLFPRRFVGEKFAVKG